MSALPGCARNLAELWANHLAPCCLSLTLWKHHQQRMVFKKSGERGDFVSVVHITETRTRAADNQPSLFLCTKQKTGSAIRNPVWISANGCPLAWSDLQRRICSGWKSPSKNICENGKEKGFQCLPLPPHQTPLDSVVTGCVWVAAIKRVSVLTEWTDAYKRACRTTMAAWQICPFLYKSISDLYAFACLMMFHLHLRVRTETQQAICLRPSFHGYYVSWSPDR